MNKNERFLTVKDFFRGRLHPFHYRFEGVSKLFRRHFEAGLAANFLPQGSL